MKKLVKFEFSIYVYRQTDEQDQNYIPHRFAGDQESEIKYESAVTTVLNSPSVLLII